MRILGAIVVGGSLIACFCLADTARASCLPDTISIPVESWNTSGTPILGEAVGQSFYASDTLITKLTVWRPPDNRSVIGAHLFITAVDTTLNPRRPDTGTIYLDGPTVHVYDSTPPGGLIEMPFVIDPPLALPHPGYYAWFFKRRTAIKGRHGSSSAMTRTRTRGASIGSPAEPRTLATWQPSVVVVTTPT